MKKRVFAGFLTAAMLLTGCAGTATDGSDNSAADGLKKMTVVLDWYPNAVHSFLYQAKEKGYFEAEGLDVTLQPPAGTNDAMSMVAAGQAQIGMYYMHDAILARTNQDVPVKSIGAVVQSPLNVILSLKENGITSPKDLVGKNIGYAGTELSEALIQCMMNDVGEDFSSVTMTDVGFELMAAVTTGQVDATTGCLINHEVPQLEKEGFELNYFSPTEYGVPDYYGFVFLTNDQMIEDQPEALEGFLRACAKGFDDFQNSTDEVLQLLLDNQDEANFALDPEVEQKSAEVLLPLMETEDATFLTQTEQCWQENIDWLYDQGMISEKRDVSEFMVQLDYQA